MENMEIIKKSSTNAIPKQRQPKIEKQKKTSADDDGRPIAQYIEKDDFDIGTMRDVLAHLVAAYVDAPSVLDKIRIARNIISFEKAMLFALRETKADAQIEIEIQNVETALRQYRTDSGNWKRAEEKVNVSFDELLRIAVQYKLMTITKDMFNVSNLRSNIGRNQGILPIATPENDI